MAGPAGLRKVYLRKGNKIKGEGRGEKGREGEGKGDRKRKQKPTNQPKTNNSEKQQKEYSKY